MIEKQQIISKIYPIINDTQTCSEIADAILELQQEDIKHKYPKPKCSECNDRFLLYDNDGQITGYCHCHY